MTLDIEAARREIASKTRDEIHAESALAWAARACAAYELATRTDDLQWLLDAEDYAAEAREHAGAAAPSAPGVGARIAALEAMLAPHRQAAMGRFR